MRLLSEAEERSLFGEAGWDSETEPVPSVSLPHRHDCIWRLFGSADSVQRKPRLHLLYRDPDVEDAVWEWSRLEPTSWNALPA